MSASRVKVEEDEIISLHDLPAYKRHNHMAFSHGLFRSELHCEFAENVQVVDQEHVSHLESTSNEEKAADNVLASSNVLKALTFQVLQVVNNNALKLKLILSNEKDAIIENSKEDMNEPGTTSVPEAASSGKITATRAEKLEIATPL